MQKSRAKSQGILSTFKKDINTVEESIDSMQAEWRKIQSRKRPIEFMLMLVYALIGLCVLIVACGFCEKMYDLAEFERHFKDTTGDDGIHIAFYKIGMTFWLLIWSTIREHIFSFFAQPDAVETEKEYLSYLNLIILGAILLLAPLIKAALFIPKRFMLVQPGQAIA